MTPYEYMMVEFECFMPEVIESKMKELGTVGWLVEHVFDQQKPKVHILLTRQSNEYAIAEPIK